MTIIYLLIGCSIFIALVFLVGFIWSIRSGQYDDTYTPAVRMLFEQSAGVESKALEGGEDEPSQEKA